MHGSRRCAGRHGRRISTPHARGRARCANIITTRVCGVILRFADMHDLRLKTLSLSALQCAREGSFGVEVAFQEDDASGDEC